MTLSIAQSASTSMDCNYLELEMLRAEAVLPAASEEEAPAPQPCSTPHTRKEGGTRAGEQQSPVLLRRAEERGFWCKNPSDQQS